MPLPILEAHLDQIVSLTAEESLLASERTAVGTGSITKESRDDALRGWRHDMGVRAAKATPFDLAAAGIGVRRVKASNDRKPRQGGTRPRNRRPRTPRRAE